MTSLTERFGDSIMDAVEAAGVDRAALYAWHMQRLVTLVDAAVAHAGPEALALMRQVQAEAEEQAGRDLAAELGDNSLASLAGVFAGPESIISLTETEAIVRTRGCRAGAFGLQTGRCDVVRALHCDCDPFLARGFNPALDCEVRCTVMDGADHCEHRLFRR